jgi:hypothetical protein
MRVVYVTHSAFLESALEPCADLSRLADLRLFVELDIGRTLHHTQPI